MANLPDPIKKGILTSIRLGVAVVFGGLWAFYLKGHYFGNIYGFTEFLNVSVICGSFILSSNIFVEYMYDKYKLNK